MIYALDSNIISYLLRADATVSSRYYEALDQGNRCVIPLIVYYEVKRGLKDAGATSKLRSFERLCDVLGIEGLDVAAVEKATDIYISLKKAGSLIGDSDTLIAASCLACGYTLVTNNAKHFGRVEGLRFVNWAE
jgi:predicted nucleic acid-binding protein